MEAFEVQINGHRLCLAGVADGVLSVIVNCVGGPERGRRLFMSVGGLDRGSDEHLRWPAPSIGVGTEVLIRVVEADAVDPPEQRYRAERPSTLELYRERLRQYRERLTGDERRQLLRDLIADLERQDAEPGAAPDPAGM